MKPLLSYFHPQRLWPENLIHLFPETLSVSKEVIPHSMKTAHNFKTIHTHTIKKNCAGVILSVNFQLSTQSLKQTICLTFA